MELKMINDKGAAGTFDAPDALFGRDFNEALVHQVVVAFQANARIGSRAQKDRGAVNHSTKKPWRQKGTGRARAGMTSSPLWRGGGKIGVEIFKVGQKVDVQGVTIGKGFAGVIKRHHFGGQNASHGNSISHRVPGSTGQNQSPAHVFPGKRMPGHLGDVRRTISNLEIVRIDIERQLLLVKGSVPGSSGRDVVVSPAVKISKPVVPGAKPQAPKAAKPEARPEAPPAKPAAKPATTQPAPKKG